ncbi:DUF6395 domain-containing protein [Isoptericola nanjingensis]|uniref:DUF6395 domain-containing protein n=1 Tax=Isoptericola nanjingensis TaxID=903413 RepID=UPI003D1D1A98
MKVSAVRDEAWVRFSCEIEDGDTPVVTPGSLAAHDARVRLPSEVQVHPDLMALAAILVFAPWSRRFEFEFGISAQFADAARDAAGFDVGPVDPALAPRSRPADSVPGLCYSGGADCTAALTVMPDSTVSYFLDRIARPDEKWRGLYRKEAAHHACAQLTRAGRTVNMVETDLEFVRSPVGFPHDFSNAVPAVLSADRDALGSIAWGAILESTYRVGSLRFRDYVKSPWFVGIGPLFEAVGLPVYNPVAGVSEVGTAIIAGRSEYGSYAQSCMRGFVGEPCRRCWKCARKILLESALSGEWPDAQEINAMAVGADTPKLFLKEPLKHEGVVAFFARRYPTDGDSEFMRLLNERVSGYSVEWLNHWYVPSMDNVPSDLREFSTARINEYLEPMSVDEMEDFRSWDMRPMLATDRRKSATAAFSEYLNGLLLEAKGASLSAG